MKLIALLVAVYLGLIQPFPAPAQTSVGEDRKSVTVSIELDRVEDIDFSQVSLRILGSSPHSIVWSELALQPLNMGRTIETSVNSEDRILVEVLTKDPTIRRSGRRDSLDFYQLYPSQPMVVFQKEYDPSNVSQGGIELKVKLQRGAAFYPCLPFGLDSGRVLMKPLFKSFEAGFSTWEFSDRARFNNVIIGGLLPGTWEIQYYDRNETLVQSQILRLSVATKSSTGCTY